MNNDLEVKNSIGIDHAWAKSPQTIGSIAMMYMGFLIMREVSPQEVGF